MVTTNSTAAVHRTIVVVDVEGFGAWQRTNHHQLVVRRGLYDCLRTSFDLAGIRWESCETEDRGDGVFVLAPPEVPKSLSRSRFPAGWTLTSIGDIATALGDVGTAVGCWRQALAICEELGAPQTAEIQARLAHAGSGVEVVN